MRRLDALPAALPEVEAVPGQVSWRLRLRAVTPIYKGGSNPKGIDAGRPFRGASIRGLLRYWWRATVDERDPERVRRAHDHDLVPEPLQQPDHRATEREVIVGDEHATVSVSATVIDPHPAIVAAWRRPWAAMTVFARRAHARRDADARSLLHVYIDR